MSDGEWVLSWRVVLTREWGWPGPRVLAFDVPSVGHLRTVVLRARRDPSIATYRYWRKRHWHGQQPSHGPCGDEYVPAGISEIGCQCGQLHRVFRCHRCGTEEIVPGHDVGCGPLPNDPAPNGR